MRRLDGIHVFKDAIAEVIDILCRNVIARHYYRTDSHRPDILIRSIRGRWDRVFAVIWRFFNQLIHMLIVQADEIHILRRCQEVIAVVGAPATTNAASILPSCSASALSPKD